MEIIAIYVHDFCWGKKKKGKENLPGEKMQAKAE